MERTLSLHDCAHIITQLSLPKGGVFRLGVFRLSSTLPILSLYRGSSRGSSVRQRTLVEAHLPRPLHTPAYYVRRRRRWWKLIFSIISAVTSILHCTSPQSPAAATVQLIAVGARARGKVIGQQAANSGGKPYHESVVVLWDGMYL